MDYSPVGASARVFSKIEDIFLWGYCTKSNAPYFFASPKIDVYWRPKTTRNQGICYQTEIYYKTFCSVLCMPCIFSILVYRVSWHAYGVSIISSYYLFVINFYQSLSSAFFRTRSPIFSPQSLPDFSPVKLYFSLPSDFQFSWMDVYAYRYYSLWADEPALSNFLLASESENLKPPSKIALSALVSS